MLADLGNDTKSRGRIRGLTLAVKLGITSILVGYLLIKVDLEGTVDHLEALPIVGAAAVVAVLGLQIVCAALRLQLVLYLLGARCPLGAAVRTALLGGFFGQTFLTFVAGDGMRVWTLHRHGVPLRTAASAVVIDRLFGLVSLLLLIAAVLPALWFLVSDVWLRAGIALTVVLGVCGTGLFLLLRLMPERLQRFRLLNWLHEVAREAWTILGRRGAALGMVGMGLAVQLTNVFAIFVLAWSLALPISLFDCLVLVPFPMLLSTLPISLGGWGVREGAMIVALGLIGVPAETSLALSILFGLGVVLVNLPGGVLWLWDRRRKAPATALPAGE